jgi:hypothetical protein
VNRADHLTPLNEPEMVAAVQPPARGWLSRISW